MDIYKIGKREKQDYLTLITQFYIEKKFETDEAAAKKANEGLARLLVGIGLEGDDLPLSKIEFFDVLLEEQTEGYYSPTITTRNSHKRINRQKVKPTIVTTALDAEDKKNVEVIKNNLLTEYPNLNRTDLAEDINNYCQLKVLVKKQIGATSHIDRDDSITIKNLTDTQIRLGNFLGIDESKKAKQKEAEDKQSIAALSVRFQQTINDFPRIREKMHYAEIRILLEKYDRQELDRRLFESDAYAGMSVEQARQFIDGLIPKYEV